MCLLMCICLGKHMGDLKKALNKEAGCLDIHSHREMAKKIITLHTSSKVASHTTKISDKTDTSIAFNIASA